MSAAWIGIYYQLDGWVTEWVWRWTWLDGTPTEYKNIVAFAPIEKGFLQACAFIRQDRAWESTSRCNPTCPQCGEDMDMLPMLCKKPAVG